MSDTQWPRFMVFQQAGQGKPVLHNGSVHAPDIEMAMLNARDVFVRRPEASELWVVPADAIYSKTREELNASVIARKAQPDEAISQAKQQTYYIFGKLSEPTQAELLGEVNASSAETALEAGVEKFSNREILRWWVFPVSAAVKSSAKDADPMFGTARDRKFTDQAEYPVVTLMRQLRAKGRLEE
jgi:ring-1,2-phenylacetyl-CoA epoxidase subunit PaaB